MLIGAMNNPQTDLASEMRDIAKAGFDFLDLTLEPPAAASWRVDPRWLRTALDEFGLGVVGHTAYYLPIGSPFEEVRRAAVAELKRCLRVFSEIGARWMNVHPDHYAPHHERKFYIERDLESLSELVEVGNQVGVGLMLENLPGNFNTAAQLADLLDPLPELGLHLDIGHANLLTKQNTVTEILHAYGPRLRHVHLHDNRGGGDDLHLPLGAGLIDIPRCIRALQDIDYDGTITLEVFTPNREYLIYSRDVLRRIWGLPRLSVSGHSQP
jgi:sugar phosphate isomerase/epimerase